MLKRHNHLKTTVTALTFMSVVCVSFVPASPTNVFAVELKQGHSNSICRTHERCCCGRTTDPRPCCCERKDDSAPAAPLINFRDGRSLKSMVWIDARVCQWLIAPPQIAKACQAFSFYS